ncbi:MAG: sensor domain-containing diguanylate cyclase, partial [Chloroflexota bacterium]|nr:sensor domain-containing diguanylate cyclase [Chloroflexota bacterium]
LIECDNIAIVVVEHSTGLLVPLTARGIHADEYLTPREPGEAGIATWVAAHNEPVLIQDEREDARVNSFRTTGVIDGSLIVVPLLGPAGAIGVLTLERLGTAVRFDEEEFELVQLFAAQVSIALRNAETFHAAEVRARTDALTGLLNHGTFKDQLARSVMAQEPFGLVMIDLDEFSRVNNSLGHQVGDRLLREIAMGIRGAARDTDAVFRYGGDEFPVILPRSDASRLVSVAERIGTAIAAVGGAGTLWAAGAVPVSASIGTASYPSDGGDAEQVLLAADRACFVAKRRGRGHVATAEEGLALAAEFTLSKPTPVDSPTVPSARR